MSLFQGLEVRLKCAGPVACKEGAQVSHCRVLPLLLLLLLSSLSLSLFLAQ